jgi:hypothetical protein
MATISGIPITINSIVKCYEKYYPESFNKIADISLFHYLHLWSIRLSAYDSKIQYDFTGGLRINNYGFHEITFSESMSEPFSGWVLSEIDSNTKKLGGVPFMKDGQYVYKYLNEDNNIDKNYPVFVPISPIKIQRWNLTKKDAEQVFSDEFTSYTIFNNALKEGRIKKSESNKNELSIVRAISEKYWANNQAKILVNDVRVLNNLWNYAKEHIDKKYGNIFMYTVFTREQFLIANGFVVPTTKKTAIDYIIKSGNFKKDRKQLERENEKYLLIWGRAILEGRSEFNYDNKIFRTNGGTRIRPL